MVIYFLDMLIRKVYLKASRCYEVWKPKIDHSNFSTVEGKEVHVSLGLPKYAQPNGLISKPGDYSISCWGLNSLLSKLSSKYATVEGKEVHVNLFLPKYAQLNGLISKPGDYSISC